MKQRIYFKIAKLAVSEMLIQAGFEKTSEDALNVLTDIFYRYLNLSFQRVQKLTMHRYNIEKIPISLHLYLNSVNTKSYLHAEMKAFLSYQNFLLRNLKEKHKAEGDSLLQILKVLPNKINFKAIKKEYRLTTQEIKSDFTESKEINVDEKMHKFIERMDSDGKLIGRGEGDENIKRRKLVISSYNEVKDLMNVEAHNREGGNFDISNLGENICCEGGVPIFRLTKEENEKFLSYKKRKLFVSEKTELFTTERVSDDFLTAEKHVVERNF